MKPIALLLILLISSCHDTGSNGYYDRNDSITIEQHDIDTFKNASKTTSHWGLIKRGIWNYEER